VALQPRIPTLTTYEHSLASSPCTSEEANRYFEVFQNQSAVTLDGFFQSPFWAQLVLQESHAVPPIHHLIASIGALTKCLERSSGPDLKVNVIQSGDQAHYVNALSYYQKATRALNAHLNGSDGRGPEVRTALIACLLFVCFETILGAVATTVRQTYGGLNILREYYASRLSSNPGKHQRPRVYATKTEMINKAVQSRVDHNSLSEPEAITAHAGEYLETGSGHPTNPESNSSAFSNSPPAQHEGTPNEQETIIALHPRGRSIPSTSERFSGQAIANGNINWEQQLQRPTTVIRESSSISPSSIALHSETVVEQSVFSPSTGPTVPFAISTTSSPATYTPPSSGPQTPSSTSSHESPLQPLPTSRKRSLETRNPNPSFKPLQNSVKLEDSLIWTLIRLDGQGLFFGMNPGIPPLIWDSHQVWNQPVPTVFPDFASARLYWDFLMNKALLFHRRIGFNRGYKPNDQDPPEQISHEYASFQKDFAAFDKAYQPWLDSAVAPDGTVQNAAALLISLHKTATLITLSATPTESEMVYDDFIPEFQYIVETCAIVLRSNTIFQDSNKWRFTFEIGVVPPLHVTATKCRDPFIRRQAVQLLFANPRQEGLWDSALTARIGRWITSCEEDGLELPADSRILQEPSGSGIKAPMQYPILPVVERNSGLGGYDDGRKISDAVNEAIQHVNDHHEGCAPGYAESQKKLKQNFEVDENTPSEQSASVTRWLVPEKNRVQLLVVEFHVPDRYINVKCRRSCPNDAGIKEEKETVIAW
jgi:hypothetical protein